MSNTERVCWALFALFILGICASEPMAIEYIVMPEELK